MTEYRLLSILYDYHIAKIINKIIWHLQRIKHGVSFGELNNIWGEICYQQQTERVMEWDLYEYAIKGKIESILEALDEDSVL